MTAGDGSFSLFVPAGTYNLTPALTNYGFQPASLSLTVPPAASNVVFAALPIFSIKQTTNGGITLSAGATAGLSYRIQASTNLSTWENISTNLAPITFTDSTTNFPTRFYRLTR
jgi:hypothetical protein